MNEGKAKAISGELLSIVKETLVELLESRKMLHERSNKTFEHGSSFVEGMIEEDKQLIAIFKEVK